MLGIPQLIAISLSLAAPSAWALDRFDQDALDLLSQDPVRVGRAKIDLMNAGEDAIPAVFSVLENKTALRWQKLLAVTIIGTIKPISQPNIVCLRLGKDARSEPSVDVRLDIEATLRGIGGPVALNELKRMAAEDPDPRARTLAIHYITQLSSQQAQSFFLEKRLNDPESQVKLAAYSELAALGNIAGRPLALKIISESKSEDERFEAFRVLGAIGDESDAPLLKDLATPRGKTFTGENERASRAYRELGLHHLSEDDKLAALIRALDDPSEGVRYWAGSELYQSHNPKKTDAVRRYMIEKGHIGYREASMGLAH